MAIKGIQSETSTVTVVLGTSPVTEGTNATFTVARMANTTGTLTVNYEASGTDDTGNAPAGRSGGVSWAGRMLRDLTVPGRCRTPQGISDQVRPWT